MARRWGMIGRIAMPLALLALLALPGAAHADIAVTITADAVVADGACSLREAVTLATLDAADASGCVDTDDEIADVITLAAGTFTITQAGSDEDLNATGDFDVVNAPSLMCTPGPGVDCDNADLRIVGAGMGAGGTTIDGDELDRIFHVHNDGAQSSIDFVLEDVRLLDGDVADGTTDDGAGVLMEDSNGALRVTEVTFESNSAFRWGGAISWDNSTNGGGAPLTIADSQFVDNTAVSGGAIWTRNSGFSGGSVDPDAEMGGATLITGSTFVGNVAEHRGGAIYVKGPADGASNTGLAVINSTIHGNQAGLGGTMGGGGAIALGAGQSRVYVFFSTVTGNSTDDAGTSGGIQTDTDPSAQQVYLRGSILAGNAASGSATDVNCARIGGAFGSITRGHNIESTNTCGLDEGGGTDDVDQAAIGLGPLGANGGSTSTRPLHAGSPALGFVPAASCVDFDLSGNQLISVDQRGEPRPAGTDCDAGAFESEDTDGDDVLDLTDNCVTDANADQANNDGDALGDVCDPDDDNDTVADGADNCSKVANAPQIDNDADAQGDECDLDDDNDGLVEGSDNCQMTANPTQLNSDGDAFGDACDSDDDNDLVSDPADNCDLTANADQANTDGDAEGNACDADDDNDGKSDAADACATSAATSRSGCPLVRRTATLKYARAKRQFTATIGAARSRCEAGRKVTLYRVRSGPDAKVATKVTAANGVAKLKLRKVPKGKYYVMVTREVVAGVAECGAATSKQLRA